MKNKVNNSAISEVKNRVKRLGEYFKTQEVALNHGQMLEAISAIENFQSWNHYSNALLKCPHTTKQLDIVSIPIGAGKDISLMFLQETLLRNNPKGCCVVFSPFSDAGCSYSQWKDRVIQCPISLKDIQTPQKWIDENRGMFKNNQGKVFWIHPSYSKINYPFDRKEQTKWLLSAQKAVSTLLKNINVLHTFIEECHMYDLNKITENELNGFLSVSNVSVTGQNLSSLQKLIDISVEKKDVVTNIISLENFHEKNRHCEHNIQYIVKQTHKTLSPKMCFEIQGWLNITQQSILKKSWSVSEPLPVVCEYENWIKSVTL